MPLRGRPEWPQPGMQAMKAMVAAGHGRCALRFGLLRQRALLQRELRGGLDAALRVSVAVAAGNELENGDDALIDLMRAIDMTALVREAHDLEDISFSLARMERGTYGRCGGCGDTIGYAHLSSNPCTAVCAGCARSR